MKVLEDKQIQTEEPSEAQIGTLMEFWTKDDDARLAKSVKDTSMGYFLAIKVNKKDKTHTKYGAPVFTLVWEEEPICEACIKGLHKQCRINYLGCIKHDEEICVYFVPPSDAAVRTATEFRWRKASQLSEDKKPTKINLIWSIPIKNPGEIEENLTTPPNNIEYEDTEDIASDVDLEEFGYLLNGTH